MFSQGWRGRLLTAGRATAFVAVVIYLLMLYSEISAMRSDISSIESDVSSIQSDVSSIEGEMPSR